MKEKEIETSIKNLITHALGGWCTKVQSGSILKEYTTRAGIKLQKRINLATAGTPDLLACIEGQFVGIEVKKNKKELDRWQAYPLGLRGKPVAHNPRIEAQKHQANDIKRSGGVALLCHNVDEFLDDMAVIAERNQLKQTLLKLNQLK